MDKKSLKCLFCSLSFSYIFSLQYLFKLCFDSDLYLNCECHSISIPKHNLQSDTRQQQEDFNKAHSFVHKIRYWGNVSIVSNYQILPQKTRQATDWETLDILLSDGKSRFIGQELTLDLILLSSSHLAILIRYRYDINREEVITWHY